MHRRLRLVTVAVAVLAPAARACPIQGFRPGTLIPASGAVPPNPQLWIANPDSIEITTSDGDVPFSQFAESPSTIVTGGTRWVAIRPHITSGDFAVSSRYEVANFHVDPTLAVQAEPLFTRLGTEVVDGMETLTIDAAAPSPTVLYVRDQAHDADVWIGPGEQRYGLTHWKLPLAALGMSCARDGTTLLNLSSTDSAGFTILGLPTELTIAHGAVKLPVGMLLLDEDQRTWQPCAGATVSARVAPTATPPSRSHVTWILLLGIAALSALALGVWLPARCGVSSSR